MELFDVEMEIRSLTDVVKMFQMREHRLPTDAEWPRFLFEGSENHPDPYVDTEWLCNGEVNDRWGNAFVYRRFKTGERDDFEIVSWGADGVPGGEGRDADTSSKRR
ncbi:MAG: hypothetical protein CL908_15485 [Deltaproteobacteria bacterium]|nr:hypothetical protein [Deltaproteobacteria bacterium]